MFSSVLTRRLTVKLKAMREESLAVTVAEWQLSVTPVNRHEKKVPNSSNSCLHGENYTLKAFYLFSSKYCRWSSTGSRYCSATSGTI